MHGRTPENSQTTFSTQQQLEWNHGTWLRQLLTGPSLGFVSAKEGGPTINLSPVGVTALNACAWGTCALLPCVEGCWRVCVCYWPLSFHEWLGNHLEIILALALISSILSHLNTRPRSRLWLGLSTVKISSEGECTCRISDMGTSDTSGAQSKMELHPVLFGKILVKLTKISKFLTALSADSETSQSPGCNGSCKDLQGPRWPKLR